MPHPPPSLYNYQHNRIIMSTRTNRPPQMHTAPISWKHLAVPKYNSTLRPNKNYRFTAAEFAKDTGRSDFVPHHS